MMLMNKIIMITLIVILVSLTGACSSEIETTQTSTTKITTTQTTPVTSLTSTTVPPTTSPIKTTTTTPPKTTTTAKPTVIPEIVIVPVDPWYQGIVDAFKASQPKDIPDHLMEDSGNKTGAEFDINIYFTILTHLSMEENYVLDYVYMYDWSFGGRPLIYVRQKEQSPYVNFEEYYTYAENITRMEDSYDFVTMVMYGDPEALENKIKIDGTEQGFFEYVVLQLLGGQFYLAWHANYDDAMIICGNEWLLKSLEDSLGNLGEEVLGFTSTGSDMSGPELVAAAASIKFEPVIELKDDTAEVSIVIFTKWGGFIKLMFTINREYPHTILDIDSEVLLEFDCGIKF